MANEITISGALSFSKAGLSAAKSFNFNVTMSGSNYEEGSFSVPTSTTAIPLGSVATNGWLLLINKDATNYVEYYTATAGTAAVKLLAGEAALFRVDGAAPAMKANTAQVEVDYLLIEA